MAAVALMQIGSGSISEVELIRVRYGLSEKVREKVKSGMSPRFLA